MVAVQTCFRIDQLTIRKEKTYHRAVYIREIPQVVRQACHIPPPSFHSQVVFIFFEKKMKKKKSI